MRLFLAAAVSFALCPAGAGAEESSGPTLEIALKASDALLRDTLRQSLAGRDGLSARYEASVAGGHATVRLDYRADAGRLTLVRRNADELQLELPVTVSRVGRDPGFLRLDEVARLGYRVEGCSSLELVARAAVTLALEAGALRLRPSAQSPAGAVRRGGCAVRKKPAADLAKALGNVAGAVIGFIGGVLGDGKLSDKGRALKRQVDALPDHVAVDALVRAAADTAVRDAVAAALASGQDRSLDRVIRAKITDGLDDDVSPRREIVSLDLRPAGVAIESAAFESPGLVVTAQARLRPRFGFAGLGLEPAGGWPAAEDIALPFEFVLPVRPVTAPPAGGEWRLSLGASGQEVGLAVVPEENGLVRVRLYRPGAAPETMIYLSAVTGPADSAGPQGNLDGMLAEVAQWLEAGTGLPAEAGESAQALGGRAEAFRGWVVQIMAALSRLQLGDVAVLKVTDPRIEISSGRYEDGLIRLPVRLIGQARLDVTL